MFSFDVLQQQPATQAVVMPKNEGSLALKGLRSPCCTLSWRCLQQGFVFSALLPDKPTHLFTAEKAKRR
jgi:hypothetical protein